MASRTEEQEQAAEVGPDFPYRAFMAHPAWSVLENAINQLESNDDVELRTASRYVIGFILKQLAASNLLPPAPAGAEPQPGRWVYLIEVAGSIARQAKSKPKTVRSGQGQPKSKPAPSAI